jgi:hypothetical protein
MKIKKHLLKLDESIDEILAKLGIILGIVAAVLSALLYGSLVILGIGTSLICFSYIYIKRKKTEEKTITSNRVSYVLITTFLILLSFSFILFHYSEPYTVSISFYIIISILYAIIVAEIFFINKESKLKYIPLLQILIVSLLFRSVIYYQFPSILGVDPWENYSMFNDIIGKGYLSSKYMYSSFPMFPISNVASLLTTGLDYKLCLFLTTGIIELSSIVFVFLLGKSICNFKTGILASLFLSFYSSHIVFGTHSIIAMSMGITFFSIIGYLIIKNHKEESLKVNILVIFFLVISILTHTIATIICLLLLLSFLIGKYLYKFLENKNINKITVTFTLTCLFGILMIAYWMWLSGYFGYVIESIKYAFQVVQGEYGPSTIQVERINFYESLFGNIEYLIIMLLLFLGGLVWLNKKNRTLERYYLFSFVSIVYLILFIVGKTGYDAILPDRWMPFLYIFLSIFICFAFIELSTKLKISGKIVTISIIFILSFIMIISNIANVETPLYKSTSRFALEKSEMNSADFIYHNYNGTVYTDNYQSLYFAYIRNEYIFYKDINTYNASFFGNDTRALTGISLIRDYTLKNYFLVEGSSKKQVGYSGSTLIEGKKFNIHIFDEANKIYDCDSVYIYNNIS